MLRQCPPLYVPGVRCRSVFWWVVRILVLSPSLSWAIPGYCLSVPLLLLCPLVVLPASSPFALASLGVSWSPGASLAGLSFPLPLVMFQPPCFTLAYQGNSYLGALSAPSSPSSIAGLSVFPMAPCLPVLHPLRPLPVLHPLLARSSL